tara:strand:- start:3185 stop:3682 length:498 start_codon:yes stop_codon:yes gene_type:complete
MSETLTHFKLLQDKKYLGAHDLIPGQDMIVTIKGAKKESIINTDNKERACLILEFVEGVKPMVINTTNAKIITKILKSAYVEHWAGKRIQLYAAKVKAFGDMVDALRVREKDLSVPVVTSANGLKILSACTTLEQLQKSYLSLTPAEQALPDVVALKEKLKTTLK